MKILIEINTNQYLDGRRTNNILSIDVIPQIVEIIRSNQLEIRTSESFEWESKIESFGVNCEVNLKVSE